MNAYAAIVCNKAGREAAAQRIRALAERLGCAIEESRLHPRGIHLTLTRAGYAVSMDFDADFARCGAFLGHWHRDLSDRRNPIGAPGLEYPDGFAGADCMHRRHHKATSQADTFLAFMAKIEAGWNALPTD